MKLTAEQIHFIDDYLEKVGVVYEDIRFEMTDHIATALENQEGDFMKNFIDFMLQHKEELLLQSKAFANMAAKRALKLFGHTLISPYMLAALAVIGFASYRLYVSYGLEVAKNSLQITFSVLFFLAVFPAAIAVITKRRGYSVAHKAINGPGLMLYMLMLIINPPLKHTQPWVILSVFSVFLVYVLTMHVTRYRLNRQYKSNYAA